MSLTIQLPSGAEIPNYKTRTFSFLLYPDTNERHRNALWELQQNYQFLGICHDRDIMVDEQSGETVPKPDHWHCIVKFRQPRYLSAVSDELGIEPNLFRDCKNFDGYSRYLLHLDDPDKEQYNFEELVGSLKPLAEKACIGKETEDERFLRLIELLDEFPCEITLKQFVSVVCKHGLYSDCRRAGYMMIRLIDEHNREVQANAS